MNRDILLLLIFSVIFSLGCTNLDLGGLNFEDLMLPECSEVELTVPPVDVESLYGIRALGKLNPPEHSLPTKHVYFQMEDINPEGYELVSPGNVRLKEITVNRNLEQGIEDYGIRFDLCKDVYGYFLHLDTLSSEIENLLNYDNCQQQGDKYVYCRVDLNYWVNAGDVLGTVGVDASVFDFGMRDSRVHLNFANPDRYSDNAVTTVCGLDYFDEETKAILYDKLLRNVEPLCGEVMQDVPGTLQGNWFYGNITADSPDTWDQEMTFIHDDMDYSKGIIGIGGVFTYPDKWYYNITHSGLFNREPSEVTPDGSIYCYEGEWNSGRIIVQLMNETAIQIEHHEDSYCDETVSFEDPVIYYR